VNPKLLGAWEYRGKFKLRAALVKPRNDWLERGGLPGPTPAINTSALIIKNLSMTNLAVKEGTSWKNWFTGFTDGEGCFCVSFSLRQKLKLNVEVKPSFSIAQHKRHKDTLLEIHSILKCGGLRFGKKDQTYKFEIRNIKHLNQTVITHFNEYPLRTQKAQDFDKFKTICFKIQHGLHLNPKGLRDIIELAYNMNPSGKRKYTKDMLLRSIPEAPGGAV
jgi:hypothetical protein